MPVGTSVRMSPISRHKNCSLNPTDGLTYAGVGWAIWRDKSFLPDEILFTVNYLGSPQVSFTLNFSKSAVHVIGQYYQFLRLGKTGYRNIVCVLLDLYSYKKIECGMRRCLT
jgi:glutamate decarboxylase